MNELTKRILFAVPAAIILVWITWIGGLPFKFFIGVIAAGTVWEVHKIVQKCEAPDYPVLSFLIGGILWVFELLPLPVILSLCGILVLFSWWSISGIENGLIKNRLLSTLFTGVYASAGLLMIVYIRSIGESSDGFWLVLAFFLMIWGNDVFAYFGGKNFGKRPLAPVISPNKTREGFYAGFAGAAVGFIIAYVAAPSFPLHIWVILPSVIIVSVMGPLGDISESSLKRIAGVKDSSNLLPGHGGLFDRFDSMILSAPFIYILYFYLV